MTLSCIDLTYITFPLRMTDDREGERQRLKEIDSETGLKKKCVLSYASLCHYYCYRHSANRAGDEMQGNQKRSRKSEGQEDG